MMTKPYYDLERSLGRCALTGGFAERFYEIFFESEPAFREQFAEFSVEKKLALLGLVINSIISFAQNRPTHISKIRQDKSKNLMTELNKDSDSYACFVNSILQAIAEFDPGFTPEIEKQWREVLQLAVNTSRGDLSGNNIFKFVDEKKQLISTTVSSQKRAVFGLGSNST